MWWLLNYVGYPLLLLFLWTIWPLIKEAKTNNSSYVMIVFLSALVATAWSGNIWLNPKELMIVHILILTCLVITSIFFSVPPKAISDGAIILGAGMVLIDTYFFIFGGYPLYHLSIINTLFILMCVITRIAYNNDRQKKEMPGGVGNGNLYAMVKKVCSNLVRAH